MCGNVGLHIFLSWLCIQLNFVYPVLGGCYYENTYGYYDCYTDVGVIIGAIIGSLFGMAILVICIILICTQIKTQGNRGHIVRPTNISSVQTVHHTQQHHNAMYPPSTSMTYPPPPPNYHNGPPPTYSDVYK